MAEVLKTDWIQTFPTNGTYNITITGNESITGIDFGNNLSMAPPTNNVTVAVRTIEKESLRLGESTNVTVNISSSTNQALSLQEIIPAGWNLKNKIMFLLMLVMLEIVAGVHQLQLIKGGRHNSVAKTNVSDCNNNLSAVSYCRSQSSQKSKCR